MPALWKSILHKDKPTYDYSNGTKSQFEMMNTPQKGSRAVHHNGTITYKDESEDSDENNLLPEGRAHVTTSIRGGSGPASSGPTNNNSQDKANYEESQIVRTVEVRQYHEG